MATARGRRRMDSDSTTASCSSGSQLSDSSDDDIGFFQACCECDADALEEILTNHCAKEEINEQDKSGRTGISHACANGFQPILEVLSQCDDVDPNLPDNDGNTPLIHAAQAGHTDVVNYILRHFTKVRVDQCNNLGFTALMKSAIQGRTKCAKVLLFAGANPNRRDSGRGLKAEEWARFCGRKTCAEAIQKYLHSKKYLLKKTFMSSRWNSEPELQTKEKDKSGNWIQRHLSFKRKKRSGGSESGSPSPERRLSKDQRTSSSPTLITTTDDDVADDMMSQTNPRRLSCIDGVVPINILPRLKRAASASGGIMQSVAEEHTPQLPPTILETDFDKDLLLRSQQTSI